MTEQEALDAMERFVQQYPQYRGIPVEELSTKLAAKFPQYAPLAQILANPLRRVLTDARVDPGTRGRLLGTGLTPGTAPEWATAHIQALQNRGIDVTPERQVAIFDLYKRESGRTDIAGIAGAEREQLRLAQRPETLGGRIQEASRAFSGTLSEAGLNLFGIVAPETAESLGEATRFQYQTGDSRAAAAGGLAGEGAKLAASIAAGPLGMAALYGTQGAGSVRREAVELREQGRDISGLREMIVAAGVGTTEAVSGLVGYKLFQALKNILGRLSPALADKFRVGNSVTTKSLVRQGLDALGVSLAEGTEEAVTQIITNKIRQGMNPEQALMEGVQESFTTGMILSPIGAGMVQEQPEAPPPTSPTPRGLLPAPPTQPGFYVTPDGKILSQLPQGPLPPSGPDLTRPAFPAPSPPQKALPPPPGFEVSPEGVVRPRGFAPPDNPQQPASPSPQSIDVRETSVFTPPTPTTTLYPDQITDTVGQTLAQQGQVSYKGRQEIDDDTFGLLFDDPVTESSFMVLAGEKFTDKLSATRKRFEGQKPELPSEVTAPLPSEIAAKTPSEEVSASQQRRQESEDAFTKVQKEFAEKRADIRRKEVIAEANAEAEINALGPRPSLRKDEHGRVITTDADALTARIKQEHEIRKKHGLSYSSAEKRYKMRVALDKQEKQARQKIQTQFAKTAPQDVAQAFAKLGPGHEAFGIQVNDLVDEGALSPEGRDLALIALENVSDEFLRRISVRVNRRLKRVWGRAILNQRRIEMGVPGGGWGKLSSMENEAITLLHEFGHIAYAAMLKPSERALIAQVYRSRSKKEWEAFFAKGYKADNAEYYADDVGEFFVQSFAEYVVNKRVSDSRLKRFFERFTKAFHTAIDRLRGRGTVDHLIPIYEKILGEFPQPAKPALTSLSHTDTESQYNRQASRPPQEIGLTDPPKWGDFIEQETVESGTLGEVVKQWGDFDVVLKWGMGPREMIKASELADNFDSIVTRKEQAGNFLREAFVGKPTAPQDDILYDRKPDVEEKIQATILPVPTRKQRAVGKIKDLARTHLVPISTVVRTISPAIYRVLKQYEFNVRSIQHNVKAGVTKRFFNPLKKALSKPQYRQYSLLILTGEFDQATQLLQEVVPAQADRLNEGFREAFNIKNIISERFRSTGAKFGFLENHWPRTVRDHKTWQQAVRGEVASEVETLINQESAKKGRSLTEEEKTDVANRVLRGYGPRKIGQAAPKRLGRRTQETITPEMQELYLDFDKSWFGYVDSVIAATEQRKLFGRSESDDLADSIGAWVRKLLAQGKITGEQETLLQGILIDRFTTGEIAPSWFVRAYRDLGYLTVLADPFAAAIQLGDFGLTMTRDGIIPAFKSLAGAKQLTAKSVGIDTIGAEFEHAGGLSAVLAAGMKWSGFAGIDIGMKTVSLNSALLKNRNLKNKPDRLQALRDRYSEVFTSDFGQLVEDLHNGKLTPLTRLYAYMEVSRVQPVDRSEMPQVYNRSPNGRLWFMLKTFFMKQLDFQRDIVITEIKTGIEKKQRHRIRRGFRDMVRILIFMGLLGAGWDWLRNWLLGKKPKVTDMMLDSALRLFGGSKYMAQNAGRDGIGSAFFDYIMPPTNLPDDLGRDIAALPDYIENPEKVIKMRSIKNIPIFGKFFYWQFGRGKDIIDKQAKQDAREAARAALKQGDIAAAMAIIDKWNSERAEGEPPLTLRQIRQELNAERRKGLRQ